MNDLLTVVRLNQKVKQVVQLSNRVYIVALNAMFQARHAKALGFNAVTTELRTFSREITEAMDELKNSIARQVRYITRYQHHNHYQQLVARIENDKYSSKTRGLAKRMHQRLEKDALEMHERFVECYREFDRAFQSALRACETGHSLYIHAKVEAQAKAEHINRLMPVVQQIENTVSEMTRELQEIRQLTQQLSFISASALERVA